MYVGRELFTIEWNSTKKQKQVSRYFFFASINSLSFNLRFETETKESFDARTARATIFRQYFETLVVFFANVMTWAGTKYKTTTT